jgi:hypothetical protein
MNDLESQFAKLKAYFSFSYRGCCIERKAGGYIFNRTIYYSKEELDKAIDSHILALNLSIRRIKIKQ